MLKALATWQEQGTTCPAWDQGKQENAISYSVHRQKLLRKKKLYLKLGSERNFS